MEAPGLDRFVGGQRDGAPRQHGERFDRVKWHEMNWGLWLIHESRLAVNRCVAPVKPSMTGKASQRPEADCGHKPIDASAMRALDGVTFAARAKQPRPAWNRQVAVGMPQGCVVARVTPNGTGRRRLRVRAFAEGHRSTSLGPDFPNRGNSRDTVRDRCARLALMKVTF
jgi:hypothetical protein